MSFLVGRPWSAKSKSSSSLASMSLSSKQNSERAPTFLLGQYKNIEKEISENIQHNYFFSEDKSDNLSIRKVVDMAVTKKKWLTQARRLFEHLDTENIGKIAENKFVEGLSTLKCDKTVDELSNLFLR